MNAAVVDMRRGYFLRFVFRGRGGMAVGSVGFAVAFFALPDPEDSFAGASSADESEAPLPCTPNSNLRASRRMAFPGWGGNGS